MVIVLFGGGLLFWLSYYVALEDQQKEWYRAQYIQKDFKGIIKEIGDYIYNPDFQEEYLNVTIATEDSLNLKEQMLENEKEAGVKKLEAAARNQKTLMAKVRLPKKRTTLSNKPVL